MTLATGSGICYAEQVNGKCFFGDITKITFIVIITYFFPFG